MLKITHASMWVHDQEEARAYYTDKVGMEVREDVTLPELGGFRWLTVGMPSQPDVSLALIAVPGPPVMDDDTAGKLRELIAKGFAGGVFIGTDDCRASYQEMKARGVEFTEEPSDRPYGVDAAFRDPSGNQVRLVETVAP
jgi:catechol 2,3-dioxygenase-like lactoylglutathione lyase family enzyme